MTDLDFARYPSKQVLAHCQGNQRSLALNPLGYQQYQRDALARAARKEAEIDEECRAFRAWRSGFLGPRRDAWAHLDEASQRAMQQALGELLRLQTAWATLAPMVTPDEREHWLAQLPAGVAEPAALAENADH